MKGRILIGIVIMLLMTLSSCRNQKIINIPDDSIDSVIVYQYDFEDQEYEEYFYYNNSRHVSEIVDAINSFEGKLLEDTIYTGDEKNIFGFSFLSNEKYSFILLDNIIVKSNGEFYIIEEDEIAELLQKFDKSSKQNFQLKYVVNHRELSLIDVEWHTEYMLKSLYDTFDDDLITLEGELIGSVDDISLKYTLTNNSSKELSYGQYLDFEVRIDDVWYQINDMTPSGFNFGWNDIGYYLMSGDTAVHEDGFLNYFYPLPSGTYRVVKEFHSTAGKHYIAFEFEM